MSSGVVSSQSAAGAAGENKQHKVAQHNRNALPRLARLVDYIITCAAVTTLDTGLADLRSLLDNCGVIRCQVGFNDDGSLLVEPHEAAVNLAVAKQVRTTWCMLRYCLPC